MMQLTQRIGFPEAFDRDLRLLTYSMSVQRLTMGFIMVVRSIYFALLGFTPVQIGLLLSIGTFVSAIRHILFGMLSDRYGRKMFLLTGGLLGAVRAVIFATSGDFLLLAVGQGVGAIGEGAGAGTPVVSGYIADKTNPQDRGQVFSTLAMTNALASTVGSLMAGLPAIFVSTLHLNIVPAHQVLFWIGAVTSAASTLLILPLREADRRTETHTVQRVTQSEGRDWGTIAKFSVIRSTSGVGWGFIQSLMSLYFFTQFGTGGEVLGPIYALSRFITMFSYMLIPAVVARWGEVKPLVASRLITAGLTVALSLATKYPIAVGLLIVQRVAIMFTMPIRQTFATGIVNPRDVATAIGVSNFARMGLRTVAPTIAGYMFETISPTSPFLSGAVFLVSNGLLYRTWFQPKKPEEAPLRKAASEAG